MRNAPASCSFRRPPLYDLEGYKPYRTSLTEQYRSIGTSLRWAAPEGVPATFFLTLKGRRLWKAHPAKSLLA